MTYETRITNNNGLGCFFSFPTPSHSDETMHDDGNYPAQSAQPCRKCLNIKRVQLYSIIYNKIIYILIQLIQ